MIDTHCHLYGKEFDEDRDQIIERARQERVLMMVQVGTSVEESRQAVALANQHDDMVASVGIHPHDAHKYAQIQSSKLKVQNENSKVNSLDIDIAELRRIAVENKEKVVAIGECGLDFGRITNQELRMTNDEVRMKRLQKELFAAQINLAADLKFPLIIHCRDAHKEVAQMIHDSGFKIHNVIIHCFTGNLEDAKRYLDLGCHISFSGIITFGKKTEGIVEAAKKVPLDRMLVETDAPFLAPVPMRGKRNEPAYVRHTMEFMAKFRGISFEELERATDENARTVFGLK